MKGIDIDFARPRLSGLLTQPSFYVLLVAVLLAGTSIYRYAKLSQELLASRLRVQTLSRTHGDAESTARAARQRPSTPPERSHAVNSAVAELNVPWPQVLEALESRRPRGVSLLHIEPRPHERTVRVTAQASGIDELLAFTQTVAGNAPFIEMQHVQHELVVLDGQSVQLGTFDARWKEPQ